MIKNYDNIAIIKPWGEEYNIFRNKKKVAITYLKLKKGFSTSLHCHPQKKTGFLILKGTAEVQIGIYRKNIRFKAIQYHLWHQESPRESLTKNDDILNESILNKTKWCQNGLKTMRQNES